MSDPYDATALDAELKSAGLAIHGCSSAGRIDWVSAPTPAQEQTAANILAAHDPHGRENELAALRARVEELFAKGEAMSDDEFREWSIKNEQLRRLGG